MIPRPSFSWLHLLSMQILYLTWILSWKSVALWFSPSDTVKNLGIIFDDSLSMKSHVSSLCRSINFHLRNLSRICPFIDRSTCAHAVRSLILSRLDYSNSLLGGLSATDTQRLQKLQNRAACLIYQVSRRTSVTPLIHELHWLPVQQRNWI